MFLSYFVLPSGLNNLYGVFVRDITRISFGPQADISGTSVTGLKGCKSLNKPYEDPKNPVEGSEDRSGAPMQPAFSYCCHISLAIGLSKTLWFAMGCFAYHVNKLLPLCGACLELVFEVEPRATNFGSLRVKLNLAPLGMPKWVWPSMNRDKMFFIQTSTIPPSMHRKLTEHGRSFFAKRSTLDRKSCWVKG